MKRELKIEKNENGLFVAAVYESNGKTLVTKSPPYASEKDAKEFARLNFEHLVEIPEDTPDKK